MKKFTKFPLYWKGIPLEVSGEYYPYRPATPEDPPEGGYVELEKAYLKGEDVTELPSDATWAELERLTYDALGRTDREYP